MDFKKLYKPNKEFKERSKTVFLSAFGAKFPKTAPKAASFTYFLRAAAFGAAFVLVLTAGATYADQENVGASNILYPLKRTTEAVKVALTSESKKPEVHLELAKRRLEEIKAIREKNPENPKILTLSKELEEEIKDSILKIEFPKDLKAATPVASFMAPSAKIVSPKTEEAKNANSFSVPSEQVGASTDQLTIEDSKSEKEVKESERAPKGNKDLEDDKNGEGKSNGSILRSKSFQLNERQVNACEFWREIVEEEDFVVANLINKSPEILQRFRESCEPFFALSSIETMGSDDEAKRGE